MPKTQENLKATLKIRLEDETRLDRFLAEQFPKKSRTYFKRLINNRNILVDEHPVSPHHHLRFGQTVKIDWPKKEVGVPFINPAELPFPILFEDEEFLVINKPPNLLCHPVAVGRKEITLVDLVAPKIARGNWPEEVRPGLVHRLDKDTSGVIVMAKTPEAHANISKQFATRQVKKTYLALVHRQVEQKKGSFECFLERHPSHRTKFVVSGQGRLAVTEFKVLEYIGPRATYLQLNPKTGRTHQLRVQLAAYHHPILGDLVYGGVSRTFPFIKRQMLHAAEIEFKHPETGKKVHFKAALPDDFQEAIKLIRLNT